MSATRTQLCLSGNEANGARKTKAGHSLAENETRQTHARGREQRREHRQRVRCQAARVALRNVSASKQVAQMNLSLDHAVDILIDARIRIVPQKQPEQAPQVKLT